MKREERDVTIGPHCFIVVFSLNEGRKYVLRRVEIHFEGSYEEIDVIERSEDPQLVVTRGHFLPEDVGALDPLGILMGRIQRIEHLPRIGSEQERVTPSSVLIVVPFDEVPACRFIAI